MKQRRKSEDNQQVGRAVDVDVGDITEPLE